MSEADQHTRTSRRYVLIMPTRDEEAYIGETLECIAAQTVPPAECVVVDDGSSDRTGELAEAAASRHPWLHVVQVADRGERRVGPGVIEAFYAGYEALRTDDYEYICKLDGDVTFPPDYFEDIMKRMEEDPKLGGASGKVFNPAGDGRLIEEHIIDQMIAGQVNFWRRQCWQDISGFVREVMWDGINFHRARMLGWHTRSFRDDRIRIIHHRLMGSSQSSIYHGRMRWGRGQWFMGTHPLYIIASGVFRMRERPYVIGGLLIIAGYVTAWLRGVERYGDLEFRKALHRWQLKRLRLGWLLPRE